MSKKSKYKVTNWSAYNSSLKQRGSLTIWISEDFDKQWYADSDARKQGRPFKYSAHCIDLMLSLRHLFKLPLRQLSGFVESIFTYMGKELPVPEFSRLSKRANCHSLLPLNTKMKDISHIVIDSTGLKVFGEKEWLETKHGKQYQRKIWRKLHLSVEENGYILSQTMTTHKTDDRSCVLPLIKQADLDHIDEVLADSGYDSHHIYAALQEQFIKPLIPPPVNANASSRSTLRNAMVEYIRKKGYWAWHTKHNFGRRARVENTFYRLKTIFGRKLLFRLIDNQQVEGHMLCRLLNKMTDLGMPQTIKIA